nr:R transactivator protein [Bovine gammaherpesvirus 4]
MKGIIYPRKSSADAYVYLSPGVREHLFSLLVKYTSSQRDSPAGSSTKVAPDTPQTNFIVEIQWVCHKILLEMEEQFGSLGGLVADINICLIWTLFRNYKHKHRMNNSDTGKSCAEYAQSVVKHLTERMVYCTDKFFINSACSGVTVPQNLALVIASISQVCRNKCQGAWRRMGNGRRTLIDLGLQLVNTYNLLNACGAIDDKCKAFIKLTFPYLNLETVYSPVHAASTGLHQKMAISLYKGQEKRKVPNATIYSNLVTQEKFALPEILLGEITDEGLLANKGPDLEKLLSEPQTILKLVTKLSPVSQFQVFMARWGDKLPSHLKDVCVSDSSQLPQQYENFKVVWPQHQTWPNDETSALPIASASLLSLQAENLPTSVQNSVAQETTGLPPQVPAGEMPPRGNCPVEDHGLLNSDAPDDLSGKGDYDLFTSDDLLPMSSGNVAIPVCEDPLAPPCKKQRIEPPDPLSTPRDNQWGDGAASAWIQSYMENEDAYLELILQGLYHLDEPPKLEDSIQVQDVSNSTNDPLEGPSRSQASCFEDTENIANPLDLFV